MTSIRKSLSAFGRALGVAAVVAATYGYSYAVWRAATYAWKAGLRFSQSYVVTGDAVRDGIHCFALGVGALVLPRFAGVGLPRVKNAGWAAYGYAALAAVAGIAVAANHVRPFFSSPFAGKGPLFFTLGPLAWELLWPGFVYGFATALAGPRATAGVYRALVALLTLAGTAWYAPLMGGLNAFETATFIGIALTTSFLGLTLRRRTGSIWPAFVGHVFVWFFLTW